MQSRIQEIGFGKKKLKTVNEKTEKLCVMFINGGIETLLYVIKNFHIATEAVSIDRINYEALKRYFKKVLGHGPAEKLRKLICNNYFKDTVLQQMVVITSFEKVLKAFINLYWTRTGPKGDVIEYLKTDKCMKPKDKNVCNHQDRIKEIMRYFMYLEGAKENLSITEQKIVVFN